MHCRVFLVAILFILNFGPLIGQKNIPELNLEKALNSRNTLTNLSELAKNIDYVKLETNPECLINYISKIYPCDEGYLINDSYRRVFFFGKDGTFKWKLDRRGQGPGEYSSCFIALDNYKSEVLITDNQNNLMVFDLNGKYLRTDSLNHKVAKMYALNDGKLITTKLGLSDGTIFKLLDTDRSIVKDYPDFFPLRPEGHDDAGRPIRIYPAYFGSIANGVLISKQDSVWILDSSYNIIPLLKTHNEIKGDEDGYYKYLVFYLDENRIGFEISWKRIRGIYHLTENKFYRFAGTEKSQLIDDIDGGIPFSFGNCIEGVFYNQINPVDLFTGDYRVRKGSKLEQLLMNSEENDNPILRVVNINLDN